MYKPFKLARVKITKSKIWLAFGLILGGGFLAVTTTWAAEVPFAIYDHACYNFNSNTNSNSNVNGNTNANGNVNTNTNSNSNTNSCEGVTNYFTGNPVLWQPNGYSHGNTFTLPEPTKLTYNYSIVYYVYRNNAWIPVADVGYKIAYGEKIKAELTKNSEWRGISGSFWDTPAPHFKDTFDWSKDIAGCYAADYFGETDVTSTESARWVRWGMYDDEGHLGYQGARLTGPVIFKNPAVNLNADSVFTCSGAECTAPTTDGTYTIKTQVSATEARQRFYMLIQAPTSYGYNACTTPGSGFPDPTRMCHELCGSGGCPGIMKQPGESYDQCADRVKSSSIWQRYVDCQNQGNLFGCTPAVMVHSSSGAKNFSPETVEASAFIPGWPADGATDTTITITVGPPSDSDIPQVTVTPKKGELVENEETEVTCSVVNPVSSEKITQIKWSCLNNTSNTSVNCSLFNGKDWITGSDYVIDIPTANQSSTYSSVIKAKSPIKGDFTIKCSATNSSSITGTGYAGIKVGNCLADGVCNPACPYDPDCCKDPYCLPYCPGYGLPHCVVAAGSCIVTRAYPSLDTSTVKIGETVKFQANLFGGSNPIAYLWSCDKNHPNEPTRKQSTAKTDEQECVYNTEGPFEPKVDYEFKNDKGDVEKSSCVNAANIGISAAGVRSVSSCDVTVKSSKSSAYTKSVDVRQNDLVDIKVDTGAGIRQNPVTWKFNRNEFSTDDEQLSRTFNDNTKIEANVDGVNCSSAKVNVKETVWWSQ